MTEADARIEYLVARHLPEPVLVLDDQKALVFANGRAKELFSGQLEEIVPTLPLWTGGRYRRFFWKRRVFETLCEEVRHQSSLYLIVILRDITASYHLQSFLSDSESHYRELFNSVPVGLLLLSPEGQVKDANETAVGLLGYRSSWKLKRLSVEQVVPDLKLRNLLREGGSFEGRVQLRRADGATFWAYVKLICSSVGRRCLLAFMDVSQLVAAEERLQVAQRLETLGRLAAGVAHDFNNVLTIFASGLEFLKLRYLQAKEECRPPSSSLLEMAGILEKMDQGLDRARSLTDRILFFARGGLKKKELIEVGEFVRRFTDISRALLGPGVAFHLELPEGPLYILADPSSLEHVFYNLLTNARDALEGEGEVRLRIYRQYLATDKRLPWGEIPAGGYVVFEVTDNGCGIAAEDLPHIFEPFYTTKEPGKGTGLGLATVFQIVRTFDGQIEVESAPGKGATFRIYLPEASGREKVPEASSKKTVSPRIRKVLIIDDEESLLELMAQSLKDLGLEVQVASKCEALSRLASRFGDVELVVMDYYMPGLSGKDCLREIRRLFPRAKVVVSSGYLSEELKEEAQALGASGFLRKPYRLHELLQFMAT